MSNKTSLLVFRVSPIIFWRIGYLRVVSGCLSVNYRGSTFRNTMFLMSEGHCVPTSQMWFFVGVP